MSTTKRQRSRVLNDVKVKVEATAENGQVGVLHDLDVEKEEVSEVPEVVEVVTLEPVVLEGAALTGATEVTDVEAAAPVEAVDTPISDSSEPDSTTEPTTTPTDDPSKIALRIVSPGLPTLNPEMETTVKISQKIQQQQRDLIASRQGKDGKEDVRSPVEKVQTISQSAQNIGPQTVQIATAQTVMPQIATVLQSISQPAAIPVQAATSTSPQSALDGSLKLLGPSSAKRLRRDNIPSPLTISSGNVAGGLGTGDPEQYKPSIQSAPLRQGQRFPLTSTGVHFPRHPPNVGSNYYYAPVKRRQYRPLPNTQVTYSQFPPTQVNPVNAVNNAPLNAAAAAPGTSGAPGPGPTPAPAAAGATRKRMFTPFTPAPFPKRPQLPPPKKSVIVPATTTSNTPVSMQKLPEKKSYSVTDVYHGDYTKAAPLLSQPLSAQREFFVSKKKKQEKDDDDRLPVSEDEIREMQEKYNKLNVVLPPIQIMQGQIPPIPGQGQDYHPAYHQQPYQNVAPIQSLKHKEIFGLINLMNQSIFNFKIFNNKEGKDVNGVRDTTETKDTNENKVATDNSKSTTPEQETPDWLAKEKEKFLKICETSWDEFVNTRKAAQAAQW